jgi:hypothetical protein
MPSKPHIVFLSVLMLMLVSVTTYAQSLKDAKVVLRSGNWKVLRTTDPMKDTTSCTGIYKENYSVQLTSETLYIGVQGGIEGVTLRFGDKPARGLRLAQEMEKRIRSLILSGSEFSELSGSTRLRYQVSTLVSGIKTDEIDLAGYDAALAYIRAGCASGADPAPQQGPSAVGTLCAPALVERMQAQGLKEEQISSMCR